MDGLNLPTPPAMLDKFTTRPTLTDEEYRREMTPKKRRRKAGSSDDATNL